MVGRVSFWEGLLQGAMLVCRAFGIRTNVFCLWPTKNHTLQKPAWEAFLGGGFWTIFWFLHDPLGKMIQIWRENRFQMGVWNHQLDSWLSKVSFYFVPWYSPPSIPTIWENIFGTFSFCIILSSWRFQLYIFYFHPYSGKIPVLTTHLKFNVAPEKLPSQKESSLPTTLFQGLC